MRRRSKIVLVVSVMVLALIAAAGFAAWGITSNPILALEPQTVESEQLAEVRSQVAQEVPSSDVLAVLYDAVQPSVVNIQVTQAAEAAAPGIPGLPFGLPDEQSETPPTVQGQGSGWIYDNDGHIVTNNHVVADATSIIVYFSNGMWAEAELVARDPAADLAVIRVTPPEGVEWRPLPLAEAGTLRVGYYVAAFGSPFGLEQTLTTGIVSAIGRTFPTGDMAGGPTYSLPDVIQTDAAINPGNSGGPLVDLDGQVVGVNFAINSPTRSNAGIGFAIPVSVVQKVVPALLAEGEYAYSYLGVAGSTIDATVAAAEDVAANRLGVFVGQVVEGGPAAEAGLQEGDIITAINDEPVTGFDDLISYLFQSTNPGETVDLTVERDGETETLSVTLTERPTAEEQGLAEQPSMEIGIAEAIRIARNAVSEAGLMEEIDTANARPDVRDGRPVWIVSLTGNDNSAAVIVDGTTGEVIELDIQ